MRNGFILLLSVAVAGCDMSPMVRGVTDKGEVFNGVATANGGWDVSGSLQFVNGRGVNCVGKFVYDGIAGPKGKADYFCSDGRSGTANLMMSRVDSGTGQGTLGGEKITFTWGK